MRAARGLPMTITATNDTARGRTNGSMGVTLTSPIPASSSSSRIPDFSE